VSFGGELLTSEPSRMASVIAHPTAGGLAPLYNARRPSFLMMLRTHSSGPEYVPGGEHCMRVLTL
jgi:hypothetical protein